jgi:tRNA modification GTPase
MSTELYDTIYAVTTGLGRSAIAVVRVSGPSCYAILKTLCPGVCFLDRRATFARIVDHEGEPIDFGIVIFFHKPRTFTGEDVVEFQVTGSRAVLAALLKTISVLPATRPADAGEFARRSFENGKRDLAEIEGLASVVEAETAVQLRHAQRSASGQLSRECDDIRQSLVRSMALMETLLDFSDIEDPEGNCLANVLTLVEDARRRIGALLRGSEHSERLRNGLVVAVAGPPNAGKSSLLNYLAKRDVSIVSAIPGTTRDLIEVPISIEGFPFILVDSAGIRKSTDPIEAEGVARAQRMCHTADLTLWLTSCVDQAESLCLPHRCELLAVRTKCDLAPSPKFDSSDGIDISTVTGAGIGALLERIVQFARLQLSGVADTLITSQRQRFAILEADSALKRFVAEHDAPLEVLAEELRFAARCMSRVVGRIDVEEVLSEVFSRLCVGK